MTMLSSPGTLERRYAIALALRALAPDAALTVLAPKDKGGSRIGEELRAFGCAVDESSNAIIASALPTPRRRSGSTRRLKRAARNWSDARPLVATRTSSAGTGSIPAARFSPNMPPLAGRGADLGCGLAPFDRRARLAGGFGMR